MGGGKMWLLTPRHDVRTSLDGRTVSQALLMLPHRGSHKMQQGCKVNQSTGRTGRGGTCLDWFRVLPALLNLYAVALP